MSNSAVTSTLTILGGWEDGTVRPMAFTSYGIASPGIPLLGCSPRAVRRRHCVGGAPVNFGRRRAAGPKNQRRRGRPKTFFSKIHEKISFYLQNFLTNFF